MAPRKTEGRGGIIFSSLSCITNSIFSWYNAPSSLYYSSSHPLTPPCNFHTLVLSFSHTTSTLLSILVSSHLSSKPAIPPSLPHLSHPPVPIPTPPLLVDHLYTPAARPGSISGGPGQWQVPLCWRVIIPQNSSSCSDGPGRRRCRNFKSSPLGGRRWGGGGEAINRADWSWISHIGQAVGIEWPKLAILFAHLLLNPAHLQPVAERSADTRKSRRDNLRKMLSLDVLFSL